MRFKEWLKQEILLENRPGTKQSLYPPGYVGIYAPCDWIPYAADSITYMPDSWLKFKFLDTFKSPPTANKIDGVKYLCLKYDDLPPE